MCDASRVFHLLQPTSEWASISRSFRNWLLLPLHPHPVPSPAFYQGSKATVSHKNSSNRVRESLRVGACEVLEVNRSWQGSREAHQQSVGMGGTELASFSSLVIQQPLEGSEALPLTQDVENPGEEPQVRASWLAQTLLQSSKGCRQARQDTPHQP